LGSAYQVRIGLYVGWRIGATALQMADVRVDFAYVEAGKITAVRLAPIRADVTELVVSVFAVSYFGMYFDRELLTRHGALNLYYDGETGEIENDRSYGLGETP
jgi:hypothetical protein